MCQKCGCKPCKKCGRPIKEKVSSACGKSIFDFICESFGEYWVGSKDSQGFTGLPFTPEGFTLRDGHK